MRLRIVEWISHGLLTQATFGLVGCALIAAALAGAQPIVETGELNGAKYRVDIPAEWNGGLVMYCHGYDPQPTDPDDPRQTQRMQAYLQEGFAVARSGYAAGGWAVEEAMQDTEALRRLFVSRHGKPKQTFITGHSMGGFLTMAILERFAHVYDGGLPFCGPLGPADWFMERRVFDFRVVFDYYFPDALPNPVEVPPEYRNTPEETARIGALLAAAPEKAAAMRQFAGIRSDEELAGTVAFWTFILMDLQQRSGGNPFDNRDTIYSGTPDDDAVNDGVRRYAANPGAIAYLQNYYTPTGRISDPMLAIHTTYDALVPPWVPNRYERITEDAGTDALFVQQYVKRPGHCVFNGEETAEAFRQLRKWVDDGVRPKGGALPSGR